MGSLAFVWGANRLVVLTRRHAIKFPSPASWRAFLFGLLNNLNESEKPPSEALCPVKWALPGGFLNVMPRVQAISDEEFSSFDAASFCREWNVRAEHKPDSFGKLNGRIVVVDYGW